ncbi:opioid growth factor receptor-like isoform X3 [Gadus macrocephalus]|uniref:opioid growth factor receptor-like isoform X3 n=1 Tax=Gadus macrocephalus TaxID=80720 RepID=UPI0028CB8ECB|nr:opioid growth factor receptor-like isoform X3 [Gadus macrocephalus]
MHLLIRAGCYPFRLLRYTFTFCCKLFCRRPRIISAYTSVGLIACLLLCLKPKKPTEDEPNPTLFPDRQTTNVKENQRSIPDRESTEGRQNRESIPDQEPTEDGEKQQSIPGRETTDVKENPRSIPDREPTDKEENAGHNEPYRVERTDLLYCQWDTTWETLEDSQGDRRPRGSTQRAYDYEFNRFENAAKDMYNYRHDYPLPMGRSYHRTKGTDMPNLTFYLGERASEPDGFSIGEFHKTWREDYYRLERVHSFVQWIFPLQEVGMNDEAFVLTKQEIKAFRKDETAKLNLQQSYRLMLDFYGIELSNPETGAVGRASNWPERFENMNRHTHNNMRLTRILKCLGTLGFRHYQAPLVRFFLEETLVQGKLPAVKESVLNYFLFAVLDRAQRRELVRFAFWNYEPREKFIWCPKKIQEAFLREGRLARCSNPADPSFEELRQVEEENNDFIQTEL